MAKEDFSQSILKSLVNKKKKLKQTSEVFICCYKIDISVVFCDEENVHFEREQISTLLKKSMHDINYFQVSMLMHRFFSKKLTDNQSLNFFITLKNTIN